MRVITACACLALLGCGPSAEGYPFARETREAVDAGRDGGSVLDAGPPEVAPDPIEDWDVTGAGPLTGLYALEVTVLANVIVDVETRQLYRLRVLQRGRDVRMRVTPCRISLPSIRGVATLAIGPDVEDVLRTKHVELEGPFLSADAPMGALFAPPSATVVLGATLDDPEGDPLPSADDPARATDEDADGAPGVSIDAVAVVCRDPQRAFVSLRAAVALSTTITSFEHLEGTLSPTLDQAVLGVSDACLAPATTLDIVIRPGSSFRAVRVGDGEELDANGNVSCPEIVWASTRMFGDYWHGTPAR